MSFIPKAREAMRYGVDRSDRDVMKLRDVIEHIESFDDELTIYAAPEWTPESAVVLAQEPDVGGVPPEAVAAGMEYFLEIFIAKEVLGGLGGLDLEGKTRRVIQYAKTDA